MFDAGVPLTMVGLDVTRKVLFTPDHLKVLQASATPWSQAAARIMGATIERLNRGPHPMLEAMHDPLTVANLIDPGILTFKDYYVEVETQGEFTAGETVGYAYAPARKSESFVSAQATPSASAADDSFRPNAKVAVEVDPDRFFRLLLGRLTAAA